ncbi:tetratricopeptide repeat protein [Microcystis aeruginosa NIES-3787]|uniref:Tetratricopeptide repeat protein n=1 Tax=Microcystis aeruginosa NIES-3787 TaxID=2517782 RepID=A0A6H9FRG4_MICAE|nr:tetratricopeptide repeat protein [Microcystis aeruginosa NIES-3787]
MITIIRSRGDLYAELKQTKKAKIDLEQAAIIFYQQNNMATYGLF